MVNRSRLTLPNELLLDIFALLSNDRDIIYKLLFLCRSFRMTIERILYKEMTDWLYSSPHDGFVSTIIENPRLASYVRCFGCIERFGITQDQGLAHEVEITQYWDTMFTAMSLMTNLKSFTINLYVPIHLPPIARLLDSLQGKDLHTFRWGPSIYDMEDTPALLSFLRNHQPHLRTLQIESSNESSMHVLGSTSCAEMESVGGAWADIVSISTGRKHNVKSLSWFKSPWDELPTQSNLHRGLLNLMNGIEELLLYHCFLGPLLSGPADPVFTFFLDKCPNLRFLHVEIDQIMQNVQALGTAFPRLEKLTLDLSAGVNNSPAPPSLLSIFSTCPTLKSIDVGPAEIFFHSGRPLDVMFVYERWLPVRKSDARALELGSSEPFDGSSEVSAVASAGFVETDAGSLFRYLPLFRAERKDRRYLKG